MWRLPALIGTAFHKVIMKTRKPFPKLSSVLFDITMKMPFLVKIYDLWNCACCGGRYNVQTLRGYIVLCCTFNSKEDITIGNKCEYNNTNKCNFNIECHVTEGNLLNDDELIRKRADGVLFLACLMRKKARKWGYCAVNATYDSLDAMITALLMGGDFCEMGISNSHDIVDLGIKVTEHPPGESRTIVLFHGKSSFTRKLWKKFGEKLDDWIDTREKLDDEYVQNWEDKIMGGKHIMEAVNTRDSHAFSFQKAFKRG